MIKLLHVISSLEIGGAQKLLSDLLPIQKQKGLAVSLLVLKLEGTYFESLIENYGITIISLNVRNLRNPLIAVHLRKIIKKYDIIHAHLVHALYLCSIASVGLSVKMVYTEHSTSNRRRSISFLRAVEKYVYGKYDKIISISKQTQDALQIWLQANDNRFIIIYNAINLERFSTIKKQIIPKSLIMVSRFVSAKDQETVIRAMREIDSEAILRLVGDGPNLMHCKQIAKECGVENRVHFLGSRTDIADLISESYIGIQSSNWEGFGLTAVEIMACGKPVVASDVEGLMQVVKNAGEIFNKGCAEELSKCVNHLLNDEIYYKKVSIRCLKRAKEFDIYKMADEYELVYIGLLKNNRI